MRLVRAATKSTRKEAVTRLREARKVVRAAHEVELAEIGARDAQIRRDARALTTCFWGSYLDIEAAHQQARSAPLYGDDGVTPAEPHFLAWRGDGFVSGQVGIQIQGGLPTSEVIGGTDTRVRLAWVPDRAGRVGYPRYGTLWLRVGSEGRAPIWAKAPVKIHRAIPDAAQWKWVRLSVRRIAMREEWSCEITVDDPAPMARTLDRSLRDAIAIEWAWTPRDDGSIHVASWADTRGERGEVVLPSLVVRGQKKASDLHAVRDMITDEVRPRLARAIASSRDVMPEWLRFATGRLQVVEGPNRPSLGWLRDLARRWRRERCDAARSAYVILDAWEERDNHLWDYEAQNRQDALRWRKDVYRKLAAGWARRYRTAIMSNQDLSREAKFGDDADVRQSVAIYELRGAVQVAFGEEDSVLARWRDMPDEDEERSWCERARDLWIAGGARGDGMFAARKEKTTNAWAARKAKKKTKAAENGGAREPGANRVE